MLSIPLKGHREASKHGPDLLLFERIWSGCERNAEAEIPAGEIGRPRRGILNMFLSWLDPQRQE
jgi:hypothetical protein